MKASSLFLFVTVTAAIWPLWKINLCDKTSPYFSFQKTWFHARFILSPLAHSVLLSFPGPVPPHLPFRFELHVHAQRLSSSAVVNNPSQLTVGCGYVIKCVSNTVTRPIKWAKPSVCELNRYIRFLLSFHYFLSPFQKIFLFQNWAIAMLTSSSSLSLLFPSPSLYLSLLEHSLSGYFLCLKHKRFLKEKVCLTPLLIVQRSLFLQSRLPTTAKISLYNFVC